MICFVSWTERRSWHDADKYVVEDWWAVLGSETIARSWREEMMVSCFWLELHGAS